MQVKIQKWGNSLAVRIPKAFAKETAIIQGTIMEMKLDGENLILLPVKRSRYNLKDLLDKITPENMHGETDFGGPQGEEIW